MVNKKIKSPVILKKHIDSLKSRGERIAFTNGCFDILHYGHVKYLEDAKNFADKLVVAVNSDASVKRLKGDKRPIVSLKDRIGLLAGLASIDYITWFDEDTPLEIIKYLKPDIIIKGADYKMKDIVGRDAVESYGGTVKKIKYIKGYSASGLIKRILTRYKAK